MRHTRLLASASAAAIAAALLRLSLHAQVPGTYTFTTVAATVGGSTARFFGPRGIAIDAEGTLYVADAINHTIRKITQAGVVSTLAGSPGLEGNTDGTGSDARFRSPNELAVDAWGNVFVVDGGSNSIRKITPGGVVTTYAGTPGTSGSAEGGVGVGRLSAPSGIAVNASGVLFVADTGSHVIVTVSTDGVITYLAGQAGSSGFTDGTGAAARFNSPFSVALDVNGDLLVGESARFRRVTPAGVVSTVPHGFGEPRGIAVRTDGTLVVVDGTYWRMVTFSTTGTPAALAGTYGAPGATDGQGANARFSQTVWGVAVDALGNAYVADAGNQVIRKVTPAGWVTTLAGRPGNSGSADGVTAFGAVSVAVDPSSVVYAADAGGHTIRKLLPAVSGTTTFAGVAEMAGMVNGPTSTGNIALFDGPGSVAVDSAGAIFVTDSTNYTIRKISPDGVVSTFAGGTGAIGALDGTGTNARFGGPGRITIDSSNNLYVTDNCTIRKITPAAVVSTLAGAAGQCSSIDGTGIAARFSRSLTGIAIDGSGTLYVADNATIRASTSAGVVTTLAGVAGAAGHVDGTGSAARFSSPNGVAFGGGLIAVTDGHTIRTVTMDGVVTTIAGQPNVPGQTDGTGGDAYFFSPGGIAVHSSGVIYVADTRNHKIRTVTSGGVVTHFAGGPGAGTGGNGSSDGTGSAARFFNPLGMTFASNGTLYVADPGNFTIRAISPAAVVSTVAGVPTQRGSTDGAATPALLTQPSGVAVTSTVMYVADTGSHSIRRIAAGQMTTLAGLPGTSGSSNGSGAAARFNLPAGVAVGSAGIFVADSGNNLIRIVTAAGDVETFATGLSNPMGVAVHTDGTVYVADTGNHVIRRITSGGSMSTLAGSLGVSGSTDGTGTGAQFNGPRGVAVASDGTVFVADAGNHTIRMITTGGLVTTVGGTAGSVGSVDGAGSAARFFEPTGITIDSTGTLYIADSKNGVVRQGIIGTLSAPVISTQPSPQSAVAGQTVQFTVAATGHPNPIYRWKKGATTPFVEATYLSDGSTYSGVNSPVLSVVTAPALASTPFWVEVTNASGTVTSNSAALTVHAITTSPASLRFDGRLPGTGTALTSVTPPQSVQVLYTGPGTQPIWTAAADVPWLTITTGSGNGSGSFTVAVAETAFNPGTFAGTITISAPNLGLTTTLSVILGVSSAANAAPVGQVDTPVQNAAGVVGAIGVTGWALDDIAVSHVRVYRNCLAYDDPLSCQVLLGQNVVFIADAPFLAGARPDVERAFEFSTYPQAHRAGWGMQVLTPMLPRTEGSTALTGGQGPITLYVIATDIDGQSILLGRTWVNDQTPTSLTLANDSIAKPFGTVDTPSHGGTASGTVISYGWALTPDSNTTVDGTDIIVPTDGSTVRVFIDGVLSGTVTYDQCRGTVGNPVPAGLYCDDDIASVFGNSTPQAPLSADRTLNPTRYRNLDAARGAIGAFSIDTTTLANGMHTLDWSVTDSANRIDGIGSRFFTVLNGGARAATVDELRAAPGLVRARASVVADLAPAAGDLWGRAGFDLSAPYQKIAPGAAGVRAVRIPEMNRLELWLGAGITAGYLEANGTLRDLPPGSRLDTTTSVFTWAPGPGYAGTYRLVFVGAGPQGQESTPISVTIWPTTIPAPGYSEIRMSLDNGAGWARDPQAFTGHGIGAVHVWAQLRSNGSNRSAPVFLGSLELGKDGGFVLPSTAGLPPGEYAVTAYAWAIRTGRWEDARTTTVTVR